MNHWYVRMQATRHELRHHGQKVREYPGSKKRQARQYQLMGVV